MDKHDPKQQEHLLHRQNMNLAVNAYLASDTSGSPANERANSERRQHAMRIQKRYWPIVEGVLSAAAARRRGALELTDDERLLVDLGLVDPRMIADGENGRKIMQTLLEEIRTPDPQDCHYLSEWLNYRQQQSRLESELYSADKTDGQENYAEQLKEARSRVLSRLSGYLTGLPGVPLEMSEMMRSGKLDQAVIVSGIEALRNPTRGRYLRRHQLWNLRERILSKARARAENQGVLRLFELLNDVYVREWRSQYESFIANAGKEETAATIADTQRLLAVTEFDPIARELHRMRMRMRLMEAMDGSEDQESILVGDGPRLSKPILAHMLPVAQMFDRALTELPHIIVMPGSGRGIFAWEAGCLILALRPLVGPDDSLATAFGWMRVLTDRLQNGSVLRAKYEAAFPGVIYPDDFLADYRSWMCRLTRGDIAALEPEKREFFRDNIGPDITGPMLPPNLRNAGPQTLMTICRRLEKQLSSDNGDAAQHRRLALIYWHQEESEAAALQFNAAMQLAPDNGETLFMAGMFMRSRGDADAANECFRFGAERAPKSMWAVYCTDALEGLF